MSAQPKPWCPSLQHGPRRLKPEPDRHFWRCPACASRHAACVVNARPELFREPVTGVRPGFDPLTGSETQDLPR
jgi:hypothetical protein